MMLDRARMVDFANHWAAGTIKTYQSKYRIMQDFERTFGVSVLHPTRLDSPPHGMAIVLMWAQERYSLYPSDWRKKHSLAEEVVKFGTVRALHSAAAHFWMWDLLLTRPNRLTLGFRDRLTVVDGCSPTDEVAYTYFADGMRRRVGDNLKPSMVFLLSHVLSIAKYFATLYHQARTLNARLCMARALITHLFAILGWLRACETFGLHWGDVTICRPAQGPTQGLPLGIGCVMCKLLAQTKSEQVRTADLVLAYVTSSGLALGPWLEILYSLTPPPLRAPTSFILCHPDGTPWTSHYFRYTHLYPALIVQRSLGDPYLSKFDGSPSKEIGKAFWSFNTYRRSGRTIVSKKREQTVRAATATKTIEHGRWRLSRSSLNMPLAYLEWSLEDRLCLTLFCM
jgi:hypothetical protein